MRSVARISTVLRIRYCTKNDIQSHWNSKIKTLSGIEMRLPVSHRKLFRLGMLFAGLMTFLLFYLAFQEVFSSRERLSEIKIQNTKVGYVAYDDDDDDDDGIDSDDDQAAQDVSFNQEEIEEDVIQATDNSPVSVSWKEYGVDEPRNHVEIVHATSRSTSKFASDRYKVLLNDPKLPDTIGGGSKSVGPPFIPILSAQSYKPPLNQASARNSQQKKTRAPLVNNDLDLTVYFESNVSTLRTPVNRQPNANVPKPYSKREPYFTIHGALPPPLDANEAGRNGYIVYQCDNLTWCGGWGDRQRGIISLYLLARLTNRKFKISMDTPCELSEFYLPKHVPWIIQPGELNHPSSHSINTFLHPNVRNALYDVDFNVKYPQNIIFFKTNQDFYLTLRKNRVYSKKLKQWPGLRMKSGRFRWAWQEVMRPSPTLLARLERILGKDILIRQGIISKSLLTSAQLAEAGPGQVGTSNLICAHVRMGKNPTIPMDENLATFNISDLPTLLNFMLSKDITGDAKFFVATDYEYIRQQSKLFFAERLVEYGSKIMHIDRQRDSQEACVGFEGALLDQLILSVCDFLVVSRSGFSIHAAQISNSTHPVYVMQDGNIELLETS